MKVCLVLGSLVLLVACTGTATRQNASYLSPALMTAMADTQVTLNASLNRIEFDNGESAGNCTEYFALSSASPIETVNNLIAAQDYVMCDSVKAVTNAGSTFTASLIAQPGALLADAVALDSFPSSVFQRTEPNSNTPKNIFNDELRVTQYGFSADSQDWLYDITVHAIVDIDGDGFEDWLVWVSDKSKQGNYSIVKPFYISHVMAGELLKLQQLPK